MISAGVLIQSPDAVIAQVRACKMARIYITATHAAQWQPLLAVPENHWQPGHSAWALAHCWQAAESFPPAVQELFENSGIFPGLELLLAIPEHRVPLRGGNRPSQNDVWALAR